MGLSVLILVRASRTRDDLMKVRRRGEERKHGMKINQRTNEMKEKKENIMKSMSVMSLHTSHERGGQ